MDCYNEYDTELSFVDIDKDLKILDNFCDLAEYRLLQYKCKDEFFYNIYDLQLKEYRERNNMTWQEVVKSWLERVSTYYYDEWDWQSVIDEKEENIKYVLDVFNEIYEVVKKHKLENEYKHILEIIKKLEDDLNSISLYDERNYEIQIVISNGNNVYIKKDDNLIFIDDITNLDYSFVEVIKDIIKNNYIK